MKPFLTALAAVAVVALNCVAPNWATPCSSASAAEKPNVIFLLADDSGFADFGCYGHPYARTPNIDRLAAEGTRFTQFYSTGVTCCPARTGWMTSRWPASFAHYPADGGFGDRVTVTELLHRAGYATGHFGKWHIGPEDKQTPGTYGIDVISDGDIRAGNRSDKKNSSRGRDAPIYAAAIHFLEQNHDRPFYMNVWGHISHHRVDPPKKYVDLFQDLVVDEAKFAPPMQAKFDNCKARGGDVAEHMRAYLADIYSLDEEVGRLLKRVDELGLSEKTIIVFSSDQGAAPLDAVDRIQRKKKVDADGLRLNAMGYGGIYRGGKHGMYEGGVRVPFIVRWPGHVPADRTDDRSVISGADWLPTLTALAGVPIDANDYVGEDVSAAWLGQGPHVRNRPLLWKTSAAGSSACIREGRWKLTSPTKKRGGELELYDIQADPVESKNLAQQQPEVVKKLSAQVEAWVATLPKEYVKADDGDK